MTEAQFRPLAVNHIFYDTDSVALINVAINFGYEYFCFVIYFSKLYLSKLFFKMVFQNFPEWFSRNLFSKFFS